MSNKINYQTRKERVKLLNDLLNGRITLASLRETAIPVLMYDTEQPGKYFDADGREYAQSELEANTAHVVIHLPYNGRARVSPIVVQGEGVQAYKTKGNEQ